MSLNVRSETQEVHMHSLAWLTLMLENDTLEIQFESPAANLVGFEHKAVSPLETKAATGAEIILKDPNKIFSFVGGNCEQRKTSVDVLGVLDEGHNKHKHRNCKHAKNLASVSVAQFSTFQEIEKINVMWITETKQGAELLTSTKRAVSLR